MNTKPKTRVLKLQSQIVQVQQIFPTKHLIQVGVLGGRKKGAFFSTKKMNF